MIVKFYRTPLLLLTLLLPVGFSLSSCTTIENRRDLYFPRCVWGPYTRMLHRGIPKPTPVQGTVTTSPSSGGKNVVKPKG